MANIGEGGGGGSGCYKVISSYHNHCHINNPNRDHIMCINGRGR
jgi:hypothetical protein